MTNYHSFFADLVDAIATATGRPMTPAEKAKAKERLAEWERQARKDAFKQRMQLGIQEMVDGPLEVK